MSASSEFFEQQFVEGDLKEVSLQNIDLKSFKNVIEYFYSGKISKLFNDVTKIG